jgi:hypothetical protein
VTPSVSADPSAALSFGPTREGRGRGRIPVIDPFREILR